MVELVLAVIGGIAVTVVGIFAISFIVVMGMKPGDMP